MNKKPENEVRTERITFVTTPEVRKKIEKVAQKDRRSLSSTVEKIIVEAVKNEK